MTCHGDLGARVDTVLIIAGNRPERPGSGQSLNSTFHLNPFMSFLIFPKFVLLHRISRRLAFIINKKGLFYSHAYVRLELTGANLRHF